MRKTVIICITSLMVLSLTIWAQAKPAKRYDATTKTCRVFGYESGWWGAGNKIFKAKCKSCHGKNNTKGATFLHTEAKSPKGWNGVFAKKYPKCYKEGHWAGLTQEQILQLNDFLYRNGNNTYDPNNAEDCG